MRPLRYSINVTLDGCCDHRAMLADEDLHRHAVENLDQAVALAELGLIDEYEFVVQPRLAGHGPTLFASSARGRWRCAMSREGKEINRSSSARRSLAAIR
jgi:hypothetical protein